MDYKSLFPQIDGLMHGGDYNPEQWLDRPDILKKDIEMMKKAHVNVVTLGVFSWSMYEPVEGEYHFDWLKEIVNNLYKNGIYFILATPSGARPAWLDKKYPKAMRTSVKGIKNRHGVRHNHCISYPKYRELVRKMDERLADEFGSHPGLLMWHISNELGGECGCEICEKKFQNYLEKKFNGDIDKLNHQWWTTFWSHKFNSFDQIEVPSSVGENTIMGLNLEWKRFNTVNTIDFMENEIAVFREKTPDIPVTTNFMHSYPLLDYNMMAKHVDIVSWDSYPRYDNNYESLADTAFGNAFDHLVMRSFKKDKPFILMESVPDLVNWHEYNHSKRPGQHRVTAMQTIACGSDSVLYFQWRKSRGSFEQYHGAVVDHLGRDDTRVFKEVSELGEILSNISEVSGSVAKAKTAIIHDWDVKWALEDALAFSKKTKKYVETVCSFLNICLRNGVEADLISQEESFDEYDVVIAPMLYLLKPGVVEKMKEFTNRGGQLITTYISGYVNENCLCYLGGFPGNGLTELFGLYVEEIDTLYPKVVNSIEFNGEEGLVGNYKAFDYCDVIKVQDAKILASYGQDFYAGTPAVTVKQNGQGNAFYIGARCESDATEKIIKKAWENVGIEAKGLPSGVEYHRRYKDKKAYDFYINYNDKPVSIDVNKAYSLLDEKEISGTYELSGLGVLVCRVQL